jgi:hypothetical protein
MTDLEAGWTTSRSDSSGCACTTPAVVQEGGRWRRCESASARTGSGAVERSDGSLPLGLHLLCSHTLAIVEALKWAQQRLSRTLARDRLGCWPAVA